MTEIEQQVKVLKKFGDDFIKFGEGIGEKEGWDKEDVQILSDFGMMLIRLSAVTKVTK